ncbi:helix-turn-helix transcriptional regulator [Francisella sp. LA112445]|uniref:helix-turn-helix domain-containing protein n=1 Tax=Francisella sp. LA112445 TaxID=1395624 RepID=UPI001788E0FA|nr:helix-turn-helix transcriptional regulator [Francisella sp. LA112445]QIW10228.1 helix-turn-helix transcriptional regulator [Francisella sp. LA112445]
MAIKINLAAIMADKKVRSKELAQAIGITEQNFSILKNQKAKAVRFSTLEAICKYLDCQPGDILIYQDDELNQ